MRVIALAAVTADGMIARQADEIANWTPPEDKRLFAALSRRAGVVIMGRRTYDTLGQPLPGRLNIILTSRPTAFPSTPDIIEYTASSPDRIIEELRARQFAEVIVAGGASVYRQFLLAGMVDELRLTVVPILFGCGVTLLGEGEQVDIKMELLRVDKLGANAVHVRYAPHPRAVPYDDERCG